MQLKTLSTGLLLFQKRIPLVLFAVTMLLSGCAKEEGIGGTSTIRGKVLVKEYQGGVLQGTYYGMEERVYCIFGDDATYGEDVRTSYDGTYEFEFLYPGTYTIFAYSDCDTCLSGTNPVLVTVEITKNNQVVEAPEIEVRR